MTAQPDQPAHGCTIDGQPAIPIPVADYNQLVADLAALRAVARGYCPDCGRGDAAPTVEDWEQQKQRADHAEARLRHLQASSEAAGILLTRTADERDRLQAALDARPAATQATEALGWLLAEEARLAQDGIDTPGCDCGHDGMGASWHSDHCPWRRAVVDCPGRPTPGLAAHNDGPTVEECREADRAHWTTKYDRP